MLQYLILLLVQNKGVSYTKHNLVADVIEVFFADAVTPTKEEVEKTVFDLAYSGMLIFSNDPEELVTITPAGLEKLLAYKPLVNIYRHMKLLHPEKKKDTPFGERKQIEVLVRGVLRNATSAKDAETKLMAMQGSTLMENYCFVFPPKVEYFSNGILRRATFFLSLVKAGSDDTITHAPTQLFDVILNMKPTKNICSP